MPDANVTETLPASPAACSCVLRTASAPACSHLHAFTLDAAVVTIAMLGPHVAAVRSKVLLAVQPSYVTTRSVSAHVDPLV